jgi:hypothetical protein
MNPPKKDDDCTAYTFGNLAARVETLEERRREQHQTNLEVFQRLNTLERRQAVVVACSSIIGGGYDRTRVAGERDGGGGGSMKSTIRT